MQTRRVGADEGAALITVIGLGAVVAGIVALAGVITTNSLSNSRQHVAFNQALDAAETGTEQMLARLQAAQNVGTTYSEPSGLTITDPLVPMTAEEVDAAARDKILELVAADPTIVQQSPTGDYVTIAPADRKAVYSMSWVPSRADARSTRFLKTEYLFSTYRPANAILTGGDLNFSGSVEVLGSDADPTIEAPIHSNGSVTVGNNSLTATGSVTASGDLNANVSTLPPGSTGGEYPRDIPDVLPEQLYQDLARDTEYLNKWFDLCPDGSVRIPATVAGAAPCTGTQVATSTQTSSSTGFHGWRWQLIGGVAKWSDGNQHESVVYYAHHGNIHIDDNASAVWRSTIIASASGACGSKSGGNISFKNQSMQPLIPGLMFVAGQDIEARASFTLGTEDNPGLLAAADQVDLDTSSATIYGAILAADSCVDTPGSPANSPNVVQGITLKFGGGLDTPVAAIIRTVLWLEMPAGA